MKKVFLTGLLVGLVILIIGMILGQGFNLLFPSLLSEYENINIFRPWSDPIMLIYFIHPFVLGIILAWLWNKTKALFGEKSYWKKGALLGFIYWIISTIPGMIVSYSSFKLSLLMIASWAVIVLVQVVCAGIVCATMNR